MPSRAIVTPWSNGFLLLAMGLGGCHSTWLNGPAHRAPALAPNGTEVTFASSQDSTFGDVAVAFLTGASLACAGPDLAECQRRLYLRPPPGAASRNLHRDQTVPSYAPYYHDAAGSGRDTDPAQGLENDTVFVYSGDGTPINWQTYGYGLKQDGTRVRGARVACLDRAHFGDGALRYAFMMSCHVMAHGPRECEGTNRPFFGCPERFVAGSDDLDENHFTCETDGVTAAAQPHQDAFSRWLPHIDPRLRLACGGSTGLSPWDASERFWQSHSIQGLPVADALLLSLSHQEYVPICLSQGERTPQSTPLYDSRFFTKENLQAPGAYGFVMYPVRGTAAATAAASVVLAVAGSDGGPLEPEGAVDENWVPPILTTDRAGLPQWLAAVADGPATAGPYGFKEVPAELVLARLSSGPPAPSVHIHPGSGAVIVRWRQGLPATALGPAVALAPSLQLTALSQQLALGPGLLTGGLGDYSAPPSSRSLVLEIDGRSAADPTAPLDRHQKCSYGTLQPRVKVTGSIVPPGDGGQRTHGLPVFGVGAEWLFGFCPGGPGSTAGAGNDELQLAGQGDVVLSLAGRQITGELPVLLDSDPPRLRAAALDRGWERLAEILGSTRAESEEIFAPPSFELGYLAAPIHCRQDKMYPIHRLTFLRKDRETVPGSPVVVDVPVYGSGMRTATDWSCDPPAAG